MVLPLIYDHRDKTYVDNGIFFESMKHLDEIGLISFQLPPSGYQRERLPQTQGASFYGKTFEIEFPKPEDNALPIGSVLLSQAGRELASICESAPCPGFQEYVIAKWRSMGLAVKEIEYGEVETS